MSPSATVIDWSMVVTNLDLTIIINWIKNCLHLFKIRCQLKLIVMVMK